VVDYESLEMADSFAVARNFARKLGKVAGEWAGIPMPIEGEDIVVHPSYRFAKVFEKSKELDEEDDIRVRNTFWSHWRRRNVHVYEENGKVRKVFERGVGNLDQQLHTMGCAVAWGVEQEHRALNLLATLLNHHLFKTYLLVGAFLESSKRSGLTYLFRRLRPTVVLKLDTKRDNVRVLCTLCMHPIGYYENSWAGVMCPTDDVLAHLMLMRGDEAMFWRRSNQHPSNRPEAGL